MEIRTLVPVCSDVIQRSSVIFLERALQKSWQSLVPEGVLEGDENDIFQAC